MCIIFRKIINKYILSTTFSAMIEKVFEMLINFFFSMVIVHLLDIKDYAVITSFTGYMTFISFMNISPETFLYKSYSILDKKQKDNQITTFLLFDSCKAILICISYITIGILLSRKFNSVYYFFIAVTNGVINIAEQFYCIGRIILELKGEQNKLTRITLFARVLRLLLIFLLLLNNSLLIYCSIMVSVAFWEDFYTFLKAFKKIKYHFYISKQDTIKNMKFAMADFVFFNHIIGVLNSIIYFSDTVFLGWFCDESVIGRYGIVLNCINYTSVLFQVIQKQASIALGRNTDINENLKSIFSFIKLSIILDVVILTIYIPFGSMMLKLYAGLNFSSEMYWYGLFILIGTCAFNAIRPLFIFLLYRGQVKLYLFRVTIPVLLCTVICYFLGSKYYGGIGVAFCNIIAYLLWNALTIKEYLNFINKHSHNGAL